MTITDEMIAAARAVLCADIEPCAWPTDDEVREALEAALAAAPIIACEITRDKVQSAPDALREAARMALELIESGTRDAVLWAEWEREVLAARDVLRGALGETK